MIRGIHHVAISTPNLDRIVAFYRDVIGCEVVYVGGWDKGQDVIDTIVGLKNSSAKQAMLKLGNAYLEFFQYLSPTGSPKDPNYGVNHHGYTHFCLDVQDIDAEYQRLKTHVVTFNCEPPKLGGPIRATYGRDPDGNVIELQQISDPEHDFALDKTTTDLTDNGPG